MERTVGGGCIKDKNGRLVVSEKDRGKLWKDHMEKVMDVENEWDQMAEADMVEGPVEEVTYEEVIKAMNKMKLGKAAGPSEVNMDMIMASGKFGVGVLKKLCQRVLDGKGMPEEWKTSVVVPIFKGKGDVMDCGAYRGVKLLEHAMKIVERVLEKRIRELVKVDDMQFGFMPGKGMTDALFILRRMQEEFRGKEKKLYMCFVDLEKAFDRVPRKVMKWALREKSLPEVLVKAVRSAILHGSETWCLRENEMVVLRRTERAMVRSMCGVKLVDRKNTEELMKMLGLKETLDKMAKGNGVRWYGHVVRRDDESILKKAMMFEVNGPRQRGRPKQTWKKQVEENIKKIGLRVEEATDCARWREGVRAIAEGMRCIRPPSDTRKNRIKTG